MTAVQTKWSFGNIATLCLALIALTASPGASWSLASHKRRPQLQHITSLPATTSPLFLQRQRALYHDDTGIATTTIQLFAAAADKEESEDTEPAAAKASSETDKVAPASAPEDEEEESFGLVKTILLAGPLFVKFTIVLL